MEKQMPGKVALRQGLITGHPAVMNGQIPQRFDGAGFAVHVLHVRHGKRRRLSKTD
jgi:hypothetical protein